MFIPDAYANVRFVFTIDGLIDEMSYAIGVRPLVTDTAASVAESADGAASDANLYSPGAMYQGWHYRGTRVTLMAAGEPIVGEFIVNLAGTIAGGTPPPNCAVLIRKNTAAGGRKNRGRFYVPPSGVGESDISSAGFLSELMQASLQATYTNLFTGLGARDLVPVLFHSDPLDPPTNVTGFNVQPLVATQRRRLR